MNTAEERPYLIACTVPPSEYIDGVALTQYVWKYYAEFLSPLERRVGAYTAPVLSTDESPKLRRLWRQLENLYGHVDDADVVEACSVGRDKFMDRIRDRILRELADVVVVNRCPQCSRVVRTPLARQCQWCKYKWHGR